MDNSDVRNAFLEPANATHRRYEALRAFFVEGMSYAEAAQRFGYTEGSFKVLCSKFRRDTSRDFFREPARGRAPKGEARQQDPLRASIIELRKRNLSIYDIADHLKSDGKTLSPPAIGRILAEEGFSRLPRRRDEERPTGSGVEQAAVADVAALDLRPRSFQTKFGGLFLFLPFLARAGLERLLEDVGFPGSDMIPAPHAVRSLLALKLFGDARHSHVMSDVFDPGLAVFAGLNVIPKVSFLSQYSCRIRPEAYPALIDGWFDVASTLGYVHGRSFDLDFHAIPFHGEDALIEKHYLSKRSRCQKGVLAIVANDTVNRAFCYVNADIRKESMRDQIIEFVEFWKAKSGRYPDELVFDSQFTTYENLNRLNLMGIRFITLRRRTAKLVEGIDQRPRSAWRRIQLENIARAYRTPRVLDERIALPGYQGELRQIAIRDLGHDSPTILITNHLQKSPATLIQRYARRMLIENNIADAIDFFHMDALSSTVAMKVNCDLVLTLVASTLYRLFAHRIGNGYETAKFGTIFRDFVHATARVTIDSDTVSVRFQKRSHNPMLIKAGYADEAVRLPWLDGKILRFEFGIPPIPGQIS